MAVAAEANDLEALVAENQRLKEELARMYSDSAPVSPSALFRPPWQLEDGAQCVHSPPIRNEGEKSEISPKANGPDAVPLPPAALASSTPAAVKRSEAAPLSPLSPQTLHGGGLKRKTGAVALPALNPSASVGRRVVSDAQSAQGEMLDFNQQPELQDRRVSTRAIWVDYANKVSTQRPRLDRNPRWMPESAAAAGELIGDGADWEVHLARNTQKRRDLRRQFREDRQGISTDQKRELIPGLVAPEEASRHLEMEQRKMEGHRQRIQDAIKGCSKARLDLVEMQRKMAGLAPQETEAKRAMNFLKDLKGGGNHRPELMAKHQHLGSLPALPEARDRTMLPKAVRKKLTGTRSVDFLSEVQVQALE
eukprot:TRINITY_DN104249_c0_g1_i1.p1 TRINITY_DN104249_c0_g1~~TRINITY_DN104249_c0_g1_i1.p1  ORF type:complete len:365 (-),score=91.53 TRINITY_DN104249_c0_g1_i1:177-1271(-)